MTGNFEVWIAGILPSIIPPKSGDTGDFDVWIAGQLPVVYVEAAGAGTDALTASDIASGTPTADTTSILEATFLRPSSDITVGSWTPSIGTTLYGTIDEAPPPSDTDFMRSENAPSASLVEVGMQAGTDPTESSFHIVRYRYRKTGTGTINLVFYLMEGVTQRATWTHNDITNSYVTGEYILSGAEADSITNYAALRIRVVATEV